MLRGLAILVVGLGTALFVPYLLVPATLPDVTNIPLNKLADTAGAILSNGAELLRSANPNRLDWPLFAGFRINPAVVNKVTLLDAKTSIAIAGLTGAAVAWIFAYFLGVLFGRLSIKALIIIGIGLALASTAFALPFNTGSGKVDPVSLWLMMTLGVGTFCGFTISKLFQSI
jgi:ABC-type enterobactin transport system permease subunit